MPLDKNTEDEDTDVYTTDMEAAFAMLMRWLHKQTEFSPEMLKEDEVQQFVRKHADILNNAVDYSIRQRPLDELNVQRLKESNFVFSGYKTFHELNEAFPSLLDEKGGRKPFEQFLTDVQKVNEKYNKWYLKAEYKFAQSAAQMAARWKGFEADGDKYLLQYRTVGDKRVRQSHRLLHNTTLPIGSKFWDSYFPPNGWGCRCTVVQVLRGKYPESDEAQAMQNGSQATAGKHQEMMRFNPGKQMACFPFYNPYTISKCQKCSNRPGGLKLAKVPDNELCAACKVIREMMKRKEELKVRRKEIQKEAEGLKDEIFTNEAFGKKITFSKKGIKEWLNQPHIHIAEKNEMLLHIKEVIKEAKYVGCGTDRHNDTITMHLFETEIKGDKSWIIVREMFDGEIRLHSISDREEILRYIKKQDK